MVIHLFRTFAKVCILNWFLPFGEDLCPSGRSGERHGPFHDLYKCPYPFHYLCKNLTRFFSLGYIMEMVRALWESLGNGRGPFWDLHKGPQPFWDLYEGLYSALGTYRGLDDRKGLRLSGKSWEGQGPSQDLYKGPLLFPGLSQWSPALAGSFSKVCTWTSFRAI